MSKTRDDTYYLPAVQSGFYLSVRLADAFSGGRDKSVLSVLLEGTDQPLVTLPEVELPSGINRWDREPFGFDRHILLVPEANVIIVIPETNDRLVLYRFDVVEALEKSGVDYLVVTSHPPTSARKGAAYRYQVMARSKKGAVKYRLDSGPSGMTISPTGLIEWAVPAEGGEPANEVVVNISDASGQERFQTFTVRVSGE